MPIIVVTLWNPDKQDIRKNRGTEELRKNESLEKKRGYPQVWKKHEMRQEKDIWKIGCTLEMRIRSDIDAHIPSNTHAHIPHDINEHTPNHINAHTPSHIDERIRVISKPTKMILKSIHNSQVDKIKVRDRMKHRSHKVGDPDLESNIPGQNTQDNPKCCAFFHLSR